MKLVIGLIAAATLVLVGSPTFAQTDCAAARCAVQSAIDQHCPCTGQTNHGQYVSCVAHQIHDLARSGQIPTNCKGKVTRCAARSTCGKADFITCTVPTGTCGTPCSANPSATCCADATTPCTTDAQCGTRCTIKHALPGTEPQVCPSPGVVGSGSCCASCN